MTAGLTRTYKQLIPGPGATGVVRTKVLILAVGAISLLLLEIGYSFALQGYDPAPSSFQLRGPFTVAIAAFGGVPRETATAARSFPRR
jgi:hypothetical protein